MNAGRANHSAVSHTVPTDDAARQEADWNCNYVVLGMGEVDRYCVFHFSMHHYDRLLDLVVVLKIIHRDAAHQSCFAPFGGPYT